MYQTSILLLLLAAFISYVSAVDGAEGLAIHKGEDEINEPFNITLDGQIYPPAIEVEGMTTTDTTNFIIECLNCSIEGDFSLSVGDNTLQFETPADVEQRGNASNFDFSDIWLAATVDSLNATFEFGVNLTEPNSNNAITIPLFSTSKSITFYILTLTATLDMALHGWVNTTNAVNLTYGFDFEVPPFSELIADASHPSESKSLGFNETSLTPLPFTASRPDFNLSFSLSFHPSFTLTASVGESFIGGSLTAQVALDVPRLSTEITQVFNVTSTCQPPTSTTLNDEIYKNLTLVARSLGFNVFEVFQENGSFFGEKPGAEQPFEQDSRRKGLPTECLAFDPTVETMRPAPVVRPTYQRSIAAAGVGVPPFTGMLVAVTVGVAGFGMSVR